MIRHFLEANGKLDPGHMMHVLGIHSIPGLDIHDPASNRHTRMVPLGAGPRAATLEFTEDGVLLECAGPPAGDAAELVQAVRSWLDLDTDLAPIQAAFGDDGLLAPLVGARPWLRSVGYLNGFEAAATTILGQQVSLAAGRTFGGRFVAAYGREAADGLRNFPRPQDVLEYGPDALREAIGLTRARATTLFAMAESFAAKDFAAPDAFPLNRKELLALRGVGPWTADYLQMRGRSDPDAFVPGDLVVRRALNRVTERKAAQLSEAWAPYRSYAMVHLWASDAA
ncbi:DNA-3-methyladenine glycosylase family protein [Paeniglutamicibacter sp. NPDC091659]|uniref:DNA-3-methyladenine glycosylase family protein n=1 Tax=Paeniglutamicibacter sp. NPDC091659 TaxID=3364389 RepID=UPI0038288F8A